MVLFFETTSPTRALTDFGFFTASLMRNIRLEARSDRNQCGVPEFQFCDHFCIGDNCNYTPKPFVVGTQATANATPSNTLAVIGILACSGRTTGKMLFCAGKVHADGTKTLTSSGGLTDMFCFK